MNKTNSALTPLAALVMAGLATPAAAAIVIEPAEMVGSVMIADRLGTKPDVIVSARFGNATIYDTAPAFTLAAYSTRSPRDIWAYRQRGYGWDRVSLWAGVPVATYRSLYSAHQFDMDYLWADEFNTRYRITQADALAMRRAGYSWRQIAQAAIVSQDTGEPIAIILPRARATRVYYPAGFAYRPRPIYVPPRFTTVVVLPARPRHAYWWNRPTSGFSLFYTSSGGFGLSLNFATQRRPLYSYWSPRPIVHGYPYRPIVIARPPRSYRPPVIVINKTVNRNNITVVNRQRERQAAMAWNQARERTVQERRKAIAHPRVDRRNGTTPVFGNAGKPNPANRLADVKRASDRREQEQREARRRAAQADAAKRKPTTRPGQDKKKRAEAAGRTAATQQALAKRRASQEAAAKRAQVTRTKPGAVAKPRPKPPIDRKVTNSPRVAPERRTPKARPEERRQPNRITAQPVRRAQSQPKRVEARRDAPRVRQATPQKRAQQPDRNGNKRGNGPRR